MYFLVCMFAVTRFCHVYTVCKLVFIIIGIESLDFGFTNLIPTCFINYEKVLQIFLSLCSSMLSVL